MKKPMTTLSLILAFASTQAVASTAEVTLTGTLVPSACTPTLSKPGIDYGNLHIDDLDAADPDYYKLRLEIIRLTVNCAQRTRFALTVSDNRFESSSTELATQFGLGTHDSKKIGHMTIRHLSASYDQELDLLPPIISMDSGGSWSYSNSNFHVAEKSPTVRHGWGRPTPAPTKYLSAALGVDGYILKDLNFNEDVHIDGNVTFQIHYL